jgi:hypothetical protein
MAVAVVALALGFGIAAQTSHGSGPPWVTLSSGGAVPVPGGESAGAVILGSRPYSPATNQSHWKSATPDAAIGSSRSTGSAMPFC